MVFLYTAFQLFFSLLFWVPVFYEYQKRLGLSDAEIFRIQSLYYLAFCLMELPTGTLADAIGRRRAMRWGAGALIAAHVLVVGQWWGAYATFLSHFMLVGLARSLISGASSAYLYDALAEEGRALEFKRIEGNARSYGLLAKVICWAGVGYLMQLNATLPYWLTGASACVALGFALALPAKGDVVAGEKTQARGALAALKLLPEAARQVREEPVLALLMLQGVGIFVLGRICAVNLFQPLLKSKDFALGAFGLVMAGMTLFEALGSARPQWPRRLGLSDRDAVTGLTVVMAASLSFAAVAGQSGTLAALALFSLAAGFAYPIQRQLMNDAIKVPGLRATLLSVESIADRSVCAWVAWMLGDFLNAGRLGDFLHLAAVVTVLSVGLISAVLRASAPSGVPIYSKSR